MNVHVSQIYILMQFRFMEGSCNYDVVYADSIVVNYKCDNNRMLHILYSVKKEFLRLLMKLYD